MYPKIAIQSKSQLAQRLSYTRFPREKSLAMINKVIINFDKLWKDSSASEPEKGKYVRSAKHSILGILLNLIDKKVLAVHDSSLPPFIFGGVSKKSHIDAVYELMGYEKNRTLISMDISRFFEQIDSRRVFHFFDKKAQCSTRGAELLTELTCVPIGPKGSKSTKLTIARGFATSPRLSIWTNLTTFTKLQQLVLRELKGHDPRIAIFVDDIGITATKVSIKKMEDVAAKVKVLLEYGDANQPLPVNDKKTKVRNWKQGLVHLGLRLGNKNVSIGSKTQSKLTTIKLLHKKTNDKESKKQLKRKLMSYRNYKKQIVGRDPRKFNLPDATLIN